MYPHLLFKKKLTIKHTLLMLNVQEKKTQFQKKYLKINGTSIEPSPDLYMLSIITGGLHGI